MKAQVLIEGRGVVPEMQTRLKRRQFSGKQVAAGCNVLIGRSEDSTQRFDYIRAWRWAKVALVLRCKLQRFAVALQSWLVWQHIINRSAGFKR